MKVSVTPAKAGVQKFFEWIPADPGMTQYGYFIVAG